MKKGIFFLFCIPLLSPFFLTHAKDISFRLPITLMFDDGSRIFNLITHCANKKMNNTIYGKTLEESTVELLEENEENTITFLVAIQACIDEMRTKNILPYSQHEAFITVKKVR